MPTHRQIVYKFLSLSVSTMHHTAIDLGLFKEGDDFSGSHTEFAKNVILRAQRQGKLEKLWKLIQTA